LQNCYGADVNMVLYCCWIALRNGLFEDTLFAAAGEFSAHWAKHVVVPLRSTRTWMKHTGCHADPVPTGACMKLRDKIKSVEFTAEKLQQQVLESLALTVTERDADPRQVLADAKENFKRYALHAGIGINGKIQRNFSKITDAAFHL